MTQELEKQQELLARLVEQDYGAGATLHSISPYQLEDRGIYRVDWQDGTTSVLRAFQGDVADELRGHAAILDYLHHYAFSAPQVQRTRDGDLLSSDAGWTALLVSYIDGHVAQFTPDHLELLGRCLGSLHTLSAPIMTAVVTLNLPESRLRPTQSIAQAIANLVETLPHVPTTLHQCGHDCLRALQRIQQTQQAGELPEVLLHGDCWPMNGICTPEGNMVLIDWDTAGIGPAILDVGYLLMACHLGKPQLPTMKADEHCIAAVVRGYCQQRKPDASELAVLGDAVLYDVARRIGLEHLLSVDAEDIRFQKMLSRYRVSSKIATLARHCFEKEMQTTYPASPNPGL